MMTTQHLSSMHIDKRIIIEKEVSSTHHPNSIDFNAKSVLDVVEDIFNSSTVAGKVDQDKLKQLEPNDEALSPQIKRISSELGSTCWSDADRHSATIALLKTVSAYPWEAKPVMVLAAFAISYVDLSLVSQLCLQMRLASKLALVQQSANPMASVVVLMKSAFDLTKSIVELNQPPSCTLPQSLNPVATYWVVRAAVVCASYCVRLRLLGSEAFKNYPTEISDLTTKIENILITDCSPILEKKREEESYQALRRQFSDEVNPAPSSSNLEVLKLIFNIKNESDEKPLLDGRSRERVGLGSLEGKSLLLLISWGLDISMSMCIFFWEFQYTTKLRVLWIPIVDYPLSYWTNQDVQQQFTEMLQRGEMISTYDPQKLIAPGFSRFVKENFFPTFQIGGEPIVVSLDHQGRNVHRNAMPLMLTRWLSDVIAAGKYNRIRVRSEDDLNPLLEKMLRERSSHVNSLIHDIDNKINVFALKIEKEIKEWASDLVKQIEDSIQSNIYTSEREKEQWKGDHWNMNLVLGGFFPDAHEWIAQKHSTFLYGGSDSEWVKNFISKVKHVSSKVHVNTQQKIVMGYVGQNKMSSRVIDFDPYISWLFWARLQSAFLSRFKYLEEAHFDQERDEIAQGLKKLLVYEAKGTIGGGGWALLSKGEEVIILDAGVKMLQVLNEFEEWKDNVATKGFDQAFKDYYDKLASTFSSYHPTCCTLEYPFTLNKIPENVRCPHCCCTMQKFVTFLCCHGDD